GGVLHWLVQPLQTASAPIANADAVVPMARLVDVQGPESAGWASFGGGSAGSSDSSGNATDAGSAAAGDHTYYASTAANASTIYCDDDPGWQDLSPQDLVSFPSLAAAMAQLPDYDLHRPC
ncbi:MAG TPA: hypothetical protein VKA15_00700, partial [Isosphaeraceae bacterium]|nr:hypothetical protein [Isosphaeraceae bacterium]